MNPTPTASTSGLTPRRRLVFRLIALVVLPVVLLGGMELGLRLLGYGYSAAFFKSARVAGREVWVENDQFGRRFFPSSMARTPAPVVVDPIKAAGVFRIVLFGESAALGDPRPGFGYGRYLQVLLEEAFPGKRFEVVCVAMTAINSHAILPIARECARLKADLWLVSIGNNEMAGPFGANTVFGFQARQASFVRWLLWSQETRLGQLALELGRKLKGSEKQAGAWSGLKLFVGAEIAPEDPRRRVVYENFQQNLRDIVETGKSAGARVVVASVASNLRDCAPFASKHAAGRSATPEFDSLVRQVSKSFATRDWTNALAGCSKLIAMEPGFAETYYVAGLCQSSAVPSEARASFEKARDRDALPFRADSALNSIASQVASAAGSETVRFLDAEKLIGQSPQGDVIPGQDLFYEHVHLTFDGNYRMARLLAESASGWIQKAVDLPAPTEWAAQEVCEQKLGLSDWNRQAAWESMLYRILDAPFSNQVNHASHVRAVYAKAGEYKSKLVPGAIVDARFQHEEAVKARPEDHWVRQSFAEFLEMTGNVEDALAQWQKVRELLPHHFLPHYQTGRLLAKARKNEAAVAALNQALALRPDLAEALLELGQVAAGEGKSAEALARYEQAERLRPDDSKIQLQMAHVLAGRGEAIKAFERLKRAVELRPTSWEARYYLGVELAAQGKLPEAQREFESVVKLRPDHALAHFNLGVALAKQGRLLDARARFEEAVRLDPQHPQAKEFLEKLKDIKAPSPSARP